VVSLTSGHALIVSVSASVTSFGCRVALSAPEPAFTILAIFLAGEEIQTGDVLPMKVFAVQNHDIIPAGRLFAAAAVGDHTLVKAALADGCSTEETSKVGTYSSKALSA
jgi:hypothetical protein